MTFLKKNFQMIYDTMVDDLKARLPELTDFEEGSVVRSLFESFSVEQASLYEQLDHVYQSAFVHTATGINLDKVVAILGITRNEPDFATGSVTFFREEANSDEIKIPIGTLITTEENKDETPSKKAFITMDEVVILANKKSVTVKVQAEQRGGQMVSKPNTVKVLPKPILGIASLTNTKNIMFLGRERETDEELRERAQKALLVSGRASRTSIENALLAVPGVLDVRVNEPKSGEIEIYVDGLTEKNTQALYKRLDEVRAAGIFATLKPSEKLFINGEFLIKANSEVLEEERRQLEEDICSAIEAYIRKLRMGESFLSAKLVADLMKIKGVADIDKVLLETWKDSNGGVSIVSKKSEVRKMDSNVFERFDPHRIRVATELKLLPIQFQVYSEYPVKSAASQLIANIQAEIDKNIPTKDTLMALDFKVDTTIVEGLTSKLAAYFSLVKDNVASLEALFSTDIIQNNDDAIIAALRAKLKAIKPGEAVVQSDFQEIIANEAKKVFEGDASINVASRLKDNLKRILPEFIDKQLALFPQQVPTDYLCVALTQFVNKRLNALTQEELANNQSLRAALTSSPPKSTDSIDKKAQQIQQERSELQLRLQQIIASSEEMISAVKKDVTARLNNLLADTALLTYTDGAARTEDYQFELNLRAVTFDDIKHEKSADQNTAKFEIQTSFLEQADFDYLWIYAHRKYLGGTIEVVTTAVATDQDKRLIEKRVKDQIIGFLDNLRPEEDIVIASLAERINQVDGVLAVTLKSDNMGIYAEDKNPKSRLNERNDKDKISVEASEKVCYSDDLLKIKI